MEKLRSKLHNTIDKHGLDYDKVIEADKELHQEIIRQQRAMMKGAK
nr:MAG: Spo0E like sporulation regulatory protein [Bacteriophage sp.]